MFNHKRIIYIATSSEIKRKNAEGVLEPTRAQNIGKICICKCFLHIKHGSKQKVIVL